MKNVKKITKIRLEQTGSDEYTILGLVSSEPDYKLSLAINKKLGISLRHSSPVSTGNQPDAIFSRFSAVDSTGTSISLIANKSENEVLIVKLKNVDYFLIAHNPDFSINTEDLLSSVRGAEHVSAVFVMESDHLKDKNIHYLIH